MAAKENRRASFVEEAFHTAFQAFDSASSYTLGIYSTSAYGDGSSPRLPVVLSAWMALARAVAAGLLHSRSHSLPLGLRASGHSLGST